MDESVRNDKANDIRRKLLELDELSDDPITLEISTSGGSVPAGMMIVDTMLTIHSKVNAICTGNALSMGGIILALATGERSALPNCVSMYHEGSWSLKGTPTDIENTVYHNRNQYERINQLLADKTGFSLEVIAELLDNRDEYFLPHEALKLNLIDVIVPVTHHAPKRNSYEERIPEWACERVTLRNSKFCP